MSAYMESRIPAYDERCYEQWKLLEDELNKKPMDQKNCKGFISKFHLIKKDAYELSQLLKKEGVSPALYMEKMAEKTAALAAVVQLAQTQQAKFEQDQLLLSGKESLFSRCNLDNAFKAAETLVEFAAIGTFGAVAGSTVGRMACAIPSPLPRAVGIMVGLATGLVKQAAKASDNEDKK